MLKKILKIIVLLIISLLLFVGVTILADYLHLTWNLFNLPIEYSHSIGFPFPFTSISYNNCHAPYGISYAAPCYRSEFLYVIIDILFWILVVFGIYKLIQLIKNGTKYK
jgi:hypothetical protein